jgi:lipopolysaccharide/colanic/teichoic acid biosynthesis glycosyltransferase
MNSFRNKPLSPFGNLLRSERERLPVESAAFFRTLAREKGRADRSNEELALIVLDTAKAQIEERELLLTFLQKRLRLTDELGWMHDNNLGILLPATTGREARIVAGSIGTALGPASSSFACIVYSDSPDAEADASGEGEDVELWDGEIEPLTPLFVVPLPPGKRTLDIIGASVLLLCALPVMLATAIAIRLESKGPVFFRQKRLGQGGKPFTLLKFRSMSVDAEQQLENLAIANLRDGPAFKMTNDPRITRVGAFIRACSVDELPQLWNVLRGEMTLVGPRPPLEKEVHNYETWQKARLNMVGGLTCIWQVDGRLKNVSFHDWMRQDIRYGSRISAFRDLQLIARTAWVVAFNRGDH